jgi:uroporphyrin-III C-methyltransferase/precorrin-2 dehydrogenase/sirohydrochlorin ferrochelatase
MRGTVVLLMAVKNLPDIAAHLVAHGRSADTPVAVVSEGTMPGERTLVSTLEKVGEDMVRDQVRPPAIVVIGEVVSVARQGRG